ncbi:MAG: glycosyltransferase family 39 protein, partial [Planctomycetes bacterium]|nr:glycosyltransferase family 39 protein [Planctomycetota bacterium]
MQNHFIQKRRLKILLILLTVALIMRIAAGFYVEQQVAARNEQGTVSSPFLFPDSDNMHATAANLAAGKGHVDDHGRFAWRMPIYQSFLAGLSLVGLSSAQAIRSVQAILDVFNCLLIFLITRRYFGGRAGLFAATMAAIYPLFIYFSALVLTETMTITALLLIVYAFSRMDENFRMDQAFLAGIMIGLGTLVKASLVFLLCFYTCWWLLLQDRKAYGYLLWGRLAKRDVWLRKSRRIIIIPACILLGTGLVLAPWAVRNRTKLDTFVLLRTAGGHALYESNSEFADGGPNNNKIIFPPGTDSMGEVERD